MSGERKDYPTALTVIKAIALSCQLKGGEYYMTKRQIVALCEAWLRIQRKSP